MAEESRGLAGRVPLLRGLPREVGVVAAISFCVALGFGIVIPAIPVFARSFGVTAFLAVAVVSVFALMRLVGAPLAGGLVNRIGERVVLSTGLMIVAVSSFLAGLAQDYVQLLILRGIGGVGSAMFTVSAMALILRTTTVNQRGRASSAFQAGFLLGGISGPALGGLVIGISIRAPFFLYAGTLALATFVSMFYLRERPAADVGAAEADMTSAAGGDALASQSAGVDPTEHAGDALASQPASVDPAEQHGVAASQTSDTVVPEEPGRDAGGGAPVATVRSALRTRGYRAALGANFVNGILTFGIRTALIPLFVVEALLRGPELASIGFLVAAVAQGISLWPAGRMTDQVGRRPALIIGMVATLVGVVMLTIASEPVVFVLAMAVMGAGAAFLASSPPAIVGDVMGPSKGGQVVAVFQMIADVGAIIGPLIAGLIVDYYGYNWAFGSTIAIVIIALILAVSMRETRVASAVPTPAR